MRGNYKILSNVAPSTSQAKERQVQSDKRMRRPSNKWRGGKEEDPTPTEVGLMVFNALHTELFLGVVSDYSQ